MFDNPKGGIHLDSHLQGQGQGQGHFNPQQPHPHSDAGREVDVANGIVT